MVMGQSDVHAKKKVCEVLLEAALFIASFPGLLSLFGL